MHDESALERQCGPVEYDARTTTRAAKSTLGPDALWDRAFSEFRRLRLKGLSDREAAGVFEAFLSDPERKDAAQFVLDLYGRVGA